MKCLFIFLTLALILSLSSSFRTTRALKDKKISLQPRIIGGKQAFINEYPYMAFVHRRWMYKNSTYKIRIVASCGSTVLNRRFVMTAAHCIRKCPCVDLDDSQCRTCKQPDIAQYLVYAGSSVPKYASETSAIKAVHIHPEYKYNDMAHDCKNRFDIAILELASPLTMGANIQRVKLVRPGQVFPTGYTCEVVGWGLTSITKPKLSQLTRKLNVARTPIISNEQCAKYITSLTGRHMCDGTYLCSESPTDSEAPCQGDSGGPILCDGVQVGITSFGITGCVGPEMPHVFTRIDVSLEWINKVISGN